MSSEKGFEDITANFYCHARTWYWECDDRPLKRPDLVNGWMRYPQPPKKVPSPTTLEDDETTRLEELPYPQRPTLICVAIHPASHFHALTLSHLHL